MPVSELKLVKRCVEFCEISEIREIRRSLVSSHQTVVRLFL